MGDRPTDVHLAAYILDQRGRSGGLGAAPIIPQERSISPRRKLSIRNPTAVRARTNYSAQVRATPGRRRSKRLFRRCRARASSFEGISYRVCGMAAHISAPAGRYSMFLRIHLGGLRDKAASSAFGNPLRGVSLGVGDSFFAGAIASAPGSVVRPSQSI